MLCIFLYFKYIR